ncbi:hypothetical protein IFM61606_05428 [Aspergillus udagawae]|nr:hypothetical protein IFM61606_05428 [Aspergillus udagawae]
MPFRACYLQAVELSHELLSIPISAQTQTEMGSWILQGDTDVSDKAIWSPSRGSTFLANIGDTCARCPNKDLQGYPLSNEELAACSDASRYLLLAPEYVAPRRTMPMKESSDHASANIYATPKEAYDRALLFLNDDPQNNVSTSWRLIDREFAFNASQLCKELVLDPDGRELVKDVNVWDGNVVVRFDVHDTEESASGAVALKVAPVLAHYHLQNVDTLLSVAANETVQVNFLAQLDKGQEKAGIRTPLFFSSNDIWA